MDKLVRDTHEEGVLQKRSVGQLQELYQRRVECPSDICMQRTGQASAFSVSATSSVLVIGQDLLGQRCTRGFSVSRKEQ